MVEEIFFRIYARKYILDSGLNFGLTRERISLNFFINIDIKCQPYKSYIHLSSLDVIIDHWIFPSLKHKGRTELPQAIGSSV